MTVALAAADLLAADGLILGTPENFGYMSGMMKDFLERVFYACEGKVNGRPYALFVGAGQDGVCGQGEPETDRRTERRAQQCDQH